MALDGTEKGMRHAAQALSRIGITQDPKLAFPGNRVSAEKMNIQPIQHYACSRAHERIIES